MLRLDTLAAKYFALPLVKLWGPKAGARVPILMYHSISNNLFGMSHPFYHINTRPAVFSAQMRWLKSAGYRTVGLEEACAALACGADLSRVVVLTFCDGYRDFYTDAVDVLTQCGFSATVFLITDRIRDTPLRVAGAEYLTWREIKFLQQTGIQFGSHTVTHPDLRSANPDQLEYELVRSKEVIEQNLGVPINSFSYPYAFPEEDKHFVRFLEDTLQNAGFDYGISSIIGRAGRDSNKFFLPRLPVNTWDEIALLRAKIEGGYDWMHWLQLKKKLLLHQPTLMEEETRPEGIRTMR